MDGFTGSRTLAWTWPKAIRSAALLRLVQVPSIIMNLYRFFFAEFKTVMRSARLLLPAVGIKNTRFLEKMGYELAYY